MIKNPYTADNVVYATVIEMLDQEIAAQRSEAEALRRCFDATGDDSVWTRYAASRVELARLVRQVRGCERDQRACMPEQSQNAEQSKRQNGEGRP